ncbi:hypothetical protein M3Y99_00416800 [Aphelenchoides fujianensis]|nr:hypothetical protein M3Y99_00416800 [Aphelenchoides fujianensis]
MINWKLAVLLLVVVMAVSALDGVPKQHIRARRNEKEEVVGPSPDHEQVKPFEFLGEKNDHHVRVARNEKEEVVGPRPEPMDVKPFEFLGTKSGHERVVRSPNKQEPETSSGTEHGEHTEAGSAHHRVARGADDGPATGPETIKDHPA